MRARENIMKKRLIIIATILTAFSSALPGILSAHDGATGIVKERMDNFKATQGHPVSYTHLTLPTILLV